MFNVYVDYPNFDDEFEVARRTTMRAQPVVEPVLSGTDFLKLQNVIRDVPVSDHLIRYALSIVRQTRVGSVGVPDFVTENVAWGAGPRAVQFLILGGKTRALMHGRTQVSIADIDALVKPVLRHRLAINFAAQSDGVSSDDIIQKLIDSTPKHSDDLTNDARFQKIFAS